MCINIPYLTKVATQKLSNQLMAHPEAMGQRLLFQNCLSFYLQIQAGCNRVTPNAQHLSFQAQDEMERTLWSFPLHVLSLPFVYAKTLAKE